MMKKTSVLLALFALFFAELALASAVVTTVSGTAQVQRGTGPARVVRLGDELNQGDTVFTGANSSLVLKFDDGQVAALTSNSRMTITTYQYNPQVRTGSILLSLIDGGMRAITGLIGKNSPERVNYRAATATIGIRGTEVFLVTHLGRIVITVEEGLISVTIGDRTFTVPAGQGVDARSDGTFQQGAAQEIIRQLPPDLRDAIGGLQGLTDAIRRAAAGEPRGGATGTTGPPGGGPTGGGAGGGGPPASPS